MVAFRLRVGRNFGNVMCTLRGYTITRQIEELEVIRETLKRQIEQEVESPPIPQHAEELKRDLEECERTIELHKKLLEKMEH